MIRALDIHYSQGYDLGRPGPEVACRFPPDATPLTPLPGDIPISPQVRRLLDGGCEPSACNIDVNHFKPYDDRYDDRYRDWRGDEMIRLMARLAEAHNVPQRDFVGYMGGDDFLILQRRPLIFTTSPSAGPGASRQGTGMASSASIRAPQCPLARFAWAAASNARPYRWPPAPHGPSAWPRGRRCRPLTLDARTLDTHALP